jgi:hypothetical protein
MKSVAAAFLLTLACIAPAQAATCPQEARLRADPRWNDSEDCELCVFNIVAVGPGAGLRWNGDAVTEARLARYLGIGAELPVPPVTLLRIANGADCALLSRVVAVIEQHANCGVDEICNFGMERDIPPPPPLPTER